MSSISRSIGAADAERDFHQLLDQVVGGEEITITRQGEAVARLIPVSRESIAKSRADAIRRLRILAGHNTLGGLRVKDLAAEGRV